MLFGRIREVVKAGTSVIYITHRLAEVRQIAQRVTVLRDGRVRGVARVDEISDADLLRSDRRPHAGFGVSQKVARQFERHQLRRRSAERREIQGRELRGYARADHRRRRRGGQRSIRIDARAGGSAEIRRARCVSTGASLVTRRLLREAAFMPSDRHSEGLAGGLTVRENATFAALDRSSPTYGILSRSKEVRAGIDDVQVARRKDAEP